MERTKVMVPVTLFVITVLTTVISGAFLSGADFLKDPFEILKGVPFSASLLTILGIHEFGHYITSRRHGMSTTLPLFIPGPPIPPMIGTFGAVIRIKTPISTRKALVDIGASGPLSGFFAAVIFTVLGLKLSTVMPAAPEKEFIGLGSSILFEVLSYATLGVVPETHDILLHPVAFAGWIGLFVTSMNLIPIGQLDGGHIVYALFGPWHRTISIVMIGALLVLGLIAWPGWFVWAALVTMIGLWHPPVEDLDIPLDGRRRFISLSTLLVFVLTFTPTPFIIK